MKFKFKCSCCGSNKSYKIETFSDDRKRERDIGGRATSKRGIFNYLLSSSGKTNAKIEITTQVDSYVCTSCGHIEFYATNLVDKIKRDESYFKDKVKVLKAQLKISKDNIKMFEREYDEVYFKYINSPCYNKDEEKDNYSDQIALMKQHHEFNDHLKGIKNEIEYEKQRIIDINKELADYTTYLSNVCDIKFR